VIELAVGHVVTDDVALFTIWLTAVDVLPAKSASPP
jgi:hypothetical protein